MGSKNVALVHDVKESAEKNDEEEQHSAVIRRVGYFFSVDVKTLLRSLQPSINSTSDALKQVHDIHTWRHAMSPCVLAFWLVVAVLLLIVRFSVVLQVVGLAALVALSPLHVAVRGLVQYCTARCRDHAPPLRAPQQQWFSEDYRKARVVARSACRVSTCFG